MTDRKKQDHDYSDEPLLDHEYDGIQEADNPLPKWWVYLFVFSFVFAIVYVPVVHILDILPGNELKAGIAQAAKVQEARQLELEASGVLDKDPVAAGKKYFGTFCVTCHGTYAEGGLCPNLTDAFWVHGPYEKDIINTITNGVSAKGMPAWGPILGDRKIKTLAAYTLTLWENSPQVKGKKPEGIEYNMADIRKPADTQEAQTDSAKAKPVESPVKKKA
jgi:cytochrome c oxidase cbb3-type subunit 3